MPISPEVLKAISREFYGRELPDDLAQLVSDRLAPLREALGRRDHGALRGIMPRLLHPWLDGSGVVAEPWPAVPSGGAPAPSAQEEPPRPAGPGGGTPCDWPLREVARAIRAGDLSPVELVDACLARIDALEPRLHGFLTTLPDRARAQARAAADAIARGDYRGPLHGIPLALKDIVETAGIRTTAGSAILSDHVPAADATVARRLAEAGAILVGKAHTHEFAWGPTNENVHYGPARNPWDPERVPGGSSGGSAVAVATGQALLGIGTDTGGSIRIPAAACGVVGLKPTYGRVSRAGVIPLSWSLDHVGPIVRHVWDAAVMLDAIAGPDPADPSTLALPPAAAPPPEGFARALHGDVAGCRIGVPREWLAGAADGEVLAAFDAAVRVLAELGCRVDDLELPLADDLMLANRIIAFAEGTAWHAPDIEHRPEAYGSNVRERLEIGRFVLATDYLHAQRLRMDTIHRLTLTMREVDLIATPALAILPPPIGSRAAPLGGGTVDVATGLIRFVAPFNVVGFPAISVPCGFSRGGLPIGLQLVGRPWEEATVLRAAAAYEAATPWHTRRPPIVEEVTRHG